MADTAAVFDKNIDYRSKFIEKYGRKCSIPSVLFLDVKFHPTIPDHIIVLSSITLNHSDSKINTMGPVELIEDMEEEINDKYFNKAKNLYFKENRAGTANTFQPSYFSFICFETSMTDWILTTV